MSGGSLGNFWLRMNHFGDAVRGALSSRKVEPAQAEVIEGIIQRVEALSQDVKLVEYWIDGDIDSAELVRLQARYGGQEQ